MRKAAPPAPKAGEPAPESTRKSSPGKVRNPWLFEKLEQRIMTLEEERKGLQDATATEEVYRDASKLREMQTRIAEIERDLHDANEEWENWQ